MQTPDCFIQSAKLKDLRNQMAEQLKKIIMTANDKRKLMIDKLENKKKDANENEHK